MRAFVSIVLVLGPALGFGVAGRTAAMGLVILAGAVAAAFLNIDKIQRFKGAGFEAEMRRLDQAVGEAYATITQLRNLARPLIHTALHILTYAGRLGGLGRSHEQEAFRDKLERLSVELGLQHDSALRAAHETYFRLKTWDHFGHFAHRVWRMNDVPLATREALMDLKDYSTTSFPTRDRIVSVLGSHWSDVEKEHGEVLKDYFHYRDSRTLRREDSLRDD